MGSATAVPRLRSPEETEPYDDGDHRPADGVVPEVSRVGSDVVAVRAVELVLLRRALLVADRVPQSASGQVERLAPGRTLPLAGQHGVPDQRDVEGRRVELEQRDYLAAGRVEESLDAEQNTGHVEPRAHQERQQLAEVVDLRAEARHRQPDADVEDRLKQQRRNGQ